MKEYRAGIYLRLSREHPEENNSIEAQREIVTNYAIKNGYKIIEEYEDNGYSGILDSRPGLNRMMLDISRGYINMVIVKDISRLTRDKNKTGWYTEKFFPDNDVRFISVTEFLDSGERYEIDDTIMLRGIANQYYIADISKKVRANKKAMRDNGQYVEHYTPYGYKKKKDDKHQIEIDEDVAENIKMIFDMYIQGKTGSQIANFLNDKKIKNIINGKKQYIFSISSLCYIVDDITGEILDYSFEDMDKYQTFEYFEDENKKIIFITENKSNQLKENEIIESVLNILE